MKTCSLCGVEKSLDQFYVTRGAKEARCKDCKNEWMRKHRSKKLEAQLLRNEEPETVCPCDHCFKQMSCETECASFRCWSEHGV